MFRSTHNALIAAKDAEIALLKKLVFNEPATHEQLVPERTADAVLSGAEVMPQRDEAEEAEELAEANRILSGNWDRVEETWG